MAQRADSRIAGVAYLLYIVFAAASAALSGRTTAGADAGETLATMGRMIGLARVTVLLDLLQVVSALVLAATLYRLVRLVSPTVALLAMLFRFGEGLLGFLPLLDKLELMRMATAGGPIDPALVSEILHRPDNGFSEFCFAVGGFLFASLFLRGHLVPRALAWVGVVTIGVQMLLVPLQIAGYVPGRVVNWFWLPILLYEVPLGVVLIARGTRVQSG